MKLEKIQKPDYLKVRHAMIAGARTIEDVKVMTDLDTVEYENDIKAILASICGCKGTSLQQVVTLARNYRNCYSLWTLYSFIRSCCRCQKIKLHQ